MESCEWDQSMRHEHEVIDGAAEAMERTTGLKARVRLEDCRPGHPDVQVHIRAADKTHKFAAEVMDVDRLAIPALVKARAARRKGQPILVAPYITRETAQHCKDLGLPFIDTAGNAYIEAKGLLIYVVGQQRPMEFAANRFRALTAAGLQVTFALLCRPDLLNTNYRAIAAAAKVALGTVGPAVKDLHARRLLQAAPKLIGRRGDYRRLLEEWATRYPTTLRPKLNVRRFDADPETLLAADLKRYNAVWGGEAAADRLTHMLRPAAFTIYTAGPIAPLAAACRLRANPRGNVEVLEKFWDFTVDGLDGDVAPAPLVYADLLATYDGRNIEAANLVYERFIEPNFHEAR
jgi:hypothetical protein